MQKVKKVEFDEFVKIFRRVYEKYGLHNAKTQKEFEEKFNEKVKEIEEFLKKKGFIY